MFSNSFLYTLILLSASFVSHSQDFIFWWLTSWECDAANMSEHGSLQNSTKCMMIAQKLCFALL